MLKWGLFLGTKLVVPWNISPCSEERGRVRSRVVEGASRGVACRTAVRQATLQGAMSIASGRVSCRTAVRQGMLQGAVSFVLKRVPCRTVVRQGKPRKVLAVGHWHDGGRSLEHDVKRDGAERVVIEDGGVVP